MNGLSTTLQVRAGERNALFKILVASYKSSSGGKKGEKPHCPSVGCQAELCSEPMLAGCSQNKAPGVQQPPPGICWHSCPKAEGIKGMCVLPAGHLGSIQSHSRASALLTAHHHAVCPWQDTLEVQLAFRGLLCCRDATPAPDEVDKNTQMKQFSQHSHPAKS